MNTEQIREFLSLETRKKQLDAELKAVNQQLDDLEQRIIDELVAAGFRSVEVDGRRIGVVRRVSASPLHDREEVIGALKASELGQYVAENYNTRSLTAFVSEVAREVEDRARQEDRLYTEDDVRAALPEPLGHTLKISFYYTLSSTKKA